jgi:putative transposase
MRVVGLPKGFYYICRHLPADLSPKTQEKWRWLGAWQALRRQGLSSTEASRALAIPRATLYRWQRLLDRRGPRGLEERSRRPHHPRGPTCNPELVQAVLTLRQKYPRWGKDKLVVLLNRQGWRASTSIVGRLVSRLKARHLLWEPVRQHFYARKKPPRPYAIRKPKDYRSREPGEMVEVDTKEVRPLPGVVIKHFTARDVHSRWDVMEAHGRATAGTASEFLESVIERMPFPVKVIQVDGRFRQ